MWVRACRVGVLSSVAGLVGGVIVAATAWGHGSVVSPDSRVHRVYASNPENPSFQLARNAIQMDGTNSYYTWTELSRNIPAAVQAGLPVGFDYSPWVPDGQLASGGRVDPNSSVYPRTYRGLDQVSAAWPTSPAQAGESLSIDFDAHTPHEPSVWDVWMTTPNWQPTEPLTWGKMEFLGRPQVTLSGMHYFFDVDIPANRVGASCVVDRVAAGRSGGRGVLLDFGHPGGGGARRDRGGLRRGRCGGCIGLHGVARSCGSGGWNAAERCRWRCDWGEAVHAVEGEFWDGRRCRECVDGAGGGCVRAGACVCDRECVVAGLAVGAIECRHESTAFNSG